MEEKQGQKEVEVKLININARKGRLKELESRHMHISLFEVFDDFRREQSLIASPCVVEGEDDITDLEVALKEVKES